MTPHNSSGKEKKSVPVYERLREELDAQLELTIVSSELPPSERLRVIENLLRTGAGRWSLAKTPVLQDANITPLPPTESKDKPHFCFSTSNEHVLRANLQTWFSPKQKPRWLKLPKTGSRGKSGKSASRHASKRQRISPDLFV
jgi:hypothetical protein